MHQNTSGKKTKTVEQEHTKTHTQTLELNNQNCLIECMPFTAPQKIWYFLVFARGNFEDKFSQCATNSDFKSIKSQLIYNNFFIVITSLYRINQSILIQSHTIWMSTSSIFTVILNWKKFNSNPVRRTEQQSRRCETNMYRPVFVVQNLSFVLRFAHCFGIVDDVLRPRRQTEKDRENEWNGSHLVNQCDCVGIVFVFVRMVLCVAANLALSQLAAHIYLCGSFVCSSKSVRASCRVRATWCMCINRTVFFQFTVCRCVSKGKQHSFQCSF